METLPHFATGWWWLGAGIALAIAEMLLPGVFLIWLGVAAMLVGVVTLSLGIPIAVQFPLFALAAVAAVFAGRRWFARNPILTSDPFLNERAQRMIGETVLVVEPIVHGSGRVRVGDGVWNAEGEDAPVGACVRVTALRGSALVVEAV